MITKTVRIDEDTWQALKELAQQMGEPMQKVLARSVETLRRQHILEATNSAYAALRDDAKAWEEEQEERRAWEATLMDNLDEER